MLTGLVDQWFQEGSEEVGDRDTSVCKYRHFMKKNLKKIVLSLFLQMSI